MRVLKFLVRILVLAAVVAAFFGVPLCWVAVKAQGLLWGVVATFVAGRFFCEAICPLGMLQSLVGWLCHPKSHVRRVCTRLPVTRRQRCVRYAVLVAFAGLAAADCMGAATMLVPISVFGKALTLWWPGLAVCALVLVTAALGDGRFWCNWVCPFGTVYSLVAKVSICRNQVGAGCGNCRKCFGDAGVATGGAEGVSLSRRETLKGVVAAAALEKSGDGGLAPVSLPGIPERENEVLPPGALARRMFRLRCAGCQLCIANCPGGCLVPSVKFASFGQPVMNFQKGYCISSCVKCGQVCPEGAIDVLQPEQRPNVHMGQAIWRKDLCVRTVNGDACNACERKCPVRAIHIVQGFPVVDRDKCIGCGACEHVCPARPLPAIHVEGFEHSRIVNPISEADLLAEMQSRIAAGAAVVVARDGVIVAEEKGRGIAPLLRLLDAGRLAGAVVVDKVIGRAAAAICVVGGAKKVFAALAGRGASELLSRNGISLGADETVDVILNHERTDSCPMEKAVKDLDDPVKMVAAIRQTLQQLKGCDSIK